MIVVGLDPGTQRTGFAVVEVLKDRSLAVCEMGVWNLLELARTAEEKSLGIKISPKERASVGARLEVLAVSCTALLEKWNPTIVGLEKAVTFKNVASALTLSEARGVIRLCAHQTLSSAELRIRELSPTAVKRQAAGFGGSSKEGVMKSVGRRFQGLETAIHSKLFSFDAFDALAVAWTAWLQSKSQLTLARSRVSAKNFEQEGSV